MAYCSPSDVRDLTGLTSGVLTDSQISGIIAHAAAQLNADIQVKWEDEQVVCISSEKENTLDGENTFFYTQHYPIGDGDNNQIISGVDVKAYTIDSSGNRVDYVVSGVIDASIGKVEVYPAPSSTETLYFTYYSSPVDMTEPHWLVKTACAQLAAALCYTRIDATKVQSFRVGKVAVMKQSQAFDVFMKQYYNTMNRIRNRVFKVEKGEKVL